MVSAFRIDPPTGHLVFPQLGVTLERMSQWKAMPEELRKLAGPDRDKRTGWIWRSISSLEFQSHSVGLMLGYRSERLETLYFSLAGPAWPTEAECRQEVQVLTKAMEAQLGVSLGTRGSAKFKWGNVYCSYDPKGGFTSAGINYGFR